MLVRNPLSVLVQVGNGWCTGELGDDERMGLRNEFWTTEIRDDGGANRCEAVCDQDQSEPRNPPQKIRCEGGRKRVH